MLGAESGPCGLEEGLALLTEAIRLTNTRFDPDRIEACLYTSQEIKLINSMAACTI